MARSEQSGDLERNKNLVRQILNAFNSGDTSVIPQVLSERIIDVMPMHGMTDQSQLPTLRRVQQEIINDHTAFPDTVFKEDEIMAEDDRVILRWSMTGTNTGPLFGREPTGKTVTTYGYEMVRIEDGKIVEHKDDGGATLVDVLRQLGWLDEEMLKLVRLIP